MKAEHREDHRRDLVQGPEGTAFAMFYLGWASHLMQDLTVVHHTFDEVKKNHQEYEDFADEVLKNPQQHEELAFAISLPAAEDHQCGEDYGDHTLPLRVSDHRCGIYEDYLNKLPDTGLLASRCGPRAKTCFPLHAAWSSHTQAELDAIGRGDFRDITVALPFAQRLQAGLYAAFLTDIGLPPIHMSAVMAAL
jgi:hypothetical protein